jgi:hypothetical protein
MSGDAFLSLAAYLPADRYAVVAELRIERCAIAVTYL